MPRKILVLSLFLLLRMIAGGQTFPTDTTLTKILKNDHLLPLLIDSAIQNSADIKRMGQNTALYEQNLQVSRKSILNSIVLNTLYGYGNAGNIAMEKDPTVLNPYVQSSTIQTSRFNLGVTIQLPLGNLFSRKNTTRVAELQIDMAESEKDAARQQVRLEVIKMYQEMKLAYALMTPAGKMQQSAKVSLDMAQKSFLDGQTSLEQFSRLQNEYNQIVIQYETQANRFQTAYLLLQAYTGVQLTRLIASTR